MYATRLWAFRHPGVGYSRVIALTCALLLTALSIGPVQAQTPASPTSTATGSFEELLSASSWLLVSGRDPRHPSALAGTAWIGPQDDEPHASIDRAPAGAFSRNLLATRSPGLAAVNADPALAVDPSNADHVVMAVNALDLPSVAIYTSLDGGENWQGPMQAPYFPGDDGAAGSPALAFGRDGTVYLVAQSISGAELPAPNGQFAVGRSRITVSASDDGGITWGDPISIAVANSDAAASIDESGLSRVDVKTAFLDRPSLVVSVDPEHPERETLAVAYTELVSRSSGGVSASAGSASLPVTETTIRLVRSTDSGQTWSAPQAISPTATRTTRGGQPIAPSPEPGPPTSPLDAVPPPESMMAASASGQVVQGAQLAALPDGTLLAAYLDSTEDGPQQGLARVMLVASADGGGTFSEPVQAGLFLEVLLRPRTSFVQWWGASFPRLAVGNNGEVYIAVTSRPSDRPSDDADVLVFASRDRGTTWNPPVNVSPDETAASQFFPAITVTPDDALVAVWADTRDDPSGIAYAIRASTSHDNGATWQAVSSSESGAADSLVSDVASNSLTGSPGGRFIGDRLAIAATGQDLYVAWPDTRLANSGAPNLQIAFARQRPVTASDESSEP